MTSKWFAFARLAGRHWYLVEPDDFDREHGLWRANRTPPGWL